MHYKESCCKDAFNGLYYSKNRGFSLGSSAFGMLRRIALLSVLQLVSLFVFLTGFFPQKKILKGEGEFQFNVELQNSTEPAFKKLVFIVIDALRSDFLYDEKSSKFHFLHSRLNVGEAWGFTAYSNPPTVTLPRLKGITTGSTPNFLDAILNVAEDDSSSNVKDQDSWPRQFHRNGYRMRFFGDDTWLKLFPLELFEEYEGTNSFFVSDFEQVDNNVTRHLSTQLKESHEWDVLILHYLGLDHIGHKGGPHSKFMPDKQIEMDGIIETLYTHLGEDTLLVVMGDHGMNDVGNHGGSSAGETSAGMLFLSKRLSRFPKPEGQRGVHLPYVPEDPSSFQYLTSIQQMDLVPTLAMLFNVPIPKNSVGLLIPEFLQLYSDTNFVETKIRENYRQLSELASEPPLGSGTDLDTIQGKMREIQKKLIRNATDYNYTNILFGYSLFVIVTVLVCLCAISLIQPLSVLLSTVGISLLFGISFFGSSFVEEEHQLWWWIITGSLSLSALRTTTVLPQLIAFFCVRLIRGWNNTGQKTTYSYVISSLLEEHTDVKWILNILTILYICLSGGSLDIWSVATTSALGVVALTYKVNWAVVNGGMAPNFLVQASEVLSKQFVAIRGLDDATAIDFTLIPLAQFFFQMVVAFIAIKIGLVTMKLHDKSTLLKGIRKYLVLLLVFLSPSTNIPLFLVYEILQKCLVEILTRQTYSLSTPLVALCSLAFQNFTFFQFGGTNSIATIDLSNAYHGISENYNIYLVGLLMLLSNFAPAIYWSMFPWGIFYVSNQGQNYTKGKTKLDIFVESKIPYMLFNCIVGCCLMAACMALRYHLFIWSVFSPKLCYYAAWNIFMYLIVGVILEGSLIILV